MARYKHKTCTFVRQLPNGQWVRCTRERGVKHDHPVSEKGLVKAVVKGQNYRFVTRVSL